MAISRNHSKWPAPELDPIIGVPEIV